MSGFEYHLCCSVCGLTSPVFCFGHRGFDRRDPDVIEMPAANLADRRFEAARLPADATTRRTPLRILAARFTDATRKLSAAVPGEGGELALDPPLACPRCASLLTAARWGSPEPIERTLRSLAQVIEETRELADGREQLFVSPEGYSIWCRRESDDAVVVNRWDLRQPKAGTADLLALAGDLMERLNALGSRCEELESHLGSPPRRVSFAERLP